MKIAVLPPCFLQLSVYGRSATFGITDKEGHFFFFFFFYYFGLLYHYHKHKTFIFMPMHKENYLGRW